MSRERGFLEHSENLEFWKSEILRLCSANGVEFKKSISLGREFGKSILATSVRPEGVSSPDSNEDTSDGICYRVAAEGAAMTQNRALAEATDRRVDVAQAVRTS